MFCDEMLGVCEICVLVVMFRFVLYFDKVVYVGVYVIFVMVFLWICVGCLWCGVNVCVWSFGFFVLYVICDEFL